MEVECLAKVSLQSVREFTSESIVVSPSEKPLITHPASSAKEKSMAALQRDILKKELQKLDMEMS
jgi:hypothetical protein